MRQDGPFIEAGENDNLIVQRLAGRPARARHLRLLVPLSRTATRLKAARGRRRRPDADTIASGDYPVSRPLFIYVKNAHRGVIPGLEEFLAEYVSEEGSARTATCPSAA